VYSGGCGGELLAVREGVRGNSANVESGHL
jgi:hypothetical protein